MKAALSFKGLLSTYLLAPGDTPEELKRLQHRWQDGTFNDEHISSFLTICAISMMSE